MTLYYIVMLYYILYYISHLFYELFTIYVRAAMVRLNSRGQDCDN